MGRSRFRAGRPIAEIVFTVADFDRIRAVLIGCGWLAGLDQGRVLRWSSAVHEVVVNAVVHAGGGGRLRVFQPVAGRLVALVDDHGPSVDRGLLRRRARYGWRLVEAFCDRVTVAGGRSGTTVRLEIARTTQAGTRPALTSVAASPCVRPRV